MRKELSVCTTLGITQEEMAMLLNVTRGHWSMYELGKRPLPSVAKKRLDELLEHATANKSLGKARHKHELRAVGQQQELLKEMLRKNEYQLMMHRKKLAPFQKKQAAIERRLQLADFLNSGLDKAKIDENLGHRLINLKVAELEYTTHATELLEREINVEVLELENGLLLKKMEKMHQSLKNLEKVKTND